MHFPRFRLTGVAAETVAWSSLDCKEFDVIEFTFPLGEFDRARLCDMEAQHNRAAFRCLGEIEKIGLRNYGRQPYPGCPLAGVCFGVT
jgi:hypothetical protein